MDNRIALTAVLAVVIAFAGVSFLDGDGYEAATGDLEPYEVSGDRSFGALETFDLTGKNVTFASGATMTFRKERDIRGWGHHDLRDRVVPPRQR